MKIGIDISQIVHGTGVSFYTSNLVRSLARIDKKNDYVLLGASLRQKKTLQDFAAEVEDLNPRFSGKIVSLPPSLAEFLGNRWRFFKVEKLTGPIDVFHSSDWIQPATKASKVTTIHDFGFFESPQAAHPKILAVMKRRLALVKKEVDFVIAVSQATAADAGKYLKLSPTKIRVIYEAPAEEHQKASPSQLKTTKRRLGVRGNYLLAVANLDPRKNLLRIIEAFVKVRANHPRLNLVIVGKPGWARLAKTAAKIKKSGIIFSGYVAHQELTVLYTGASCLVYPSLYEGFGLPILEAMKAGCPVVTSNLSSMPEVAGKSAVLVDPSNATEIARGIEEALERRQELVKRGQARVKKFSWLKVAKQTLKVYEEAARKH